MRRLSRGDRLRLTASSVSQRKVAAEQAQMAAAVQAATSGQQSFAGAASLQHGQARHVPRSLAHLCSCHINSKLLMHLDFRCFVVCISERARIRVKAWIRGHVHAPRLQPVFLGENHPLTTAPPFSRGLTSPVRCAAAADAGYASFRAPSEQLPSSSPFSGAIQLRGADGCWPRSIPSAGAQAAAAQSANYPVML